MKGGAREGEGRKKGSGQAADYRAMLEPYAEQLISNGFEVLLQGGGGFHLDSCGYPPASRPYDFYFPRSEVMR